MLQKDRRVDKGNKYGAVFGRYGFLKGEGGVVEVGDEVRVSRRNSETTAFGRWLTYLKSHQRHIRTQLTDWQFGPENLTLNVAAILDDHPKIYLTDNITFRANKKISCLTLSLFLKYLNLLSTHLNPHNRSEIPTSYQILSYDVF